MWKFVRVHLSPPFNTNPSIMDNIFLQSADGKRFVASLQNLANGMTLKQAIPTVSPTLFLYNGDSTKTYAVHYIHKYLTSGTAAAGSTLLVALSPGVLTPHPTSNATNYSIQKLGNQSRGDSSSAKISTGVTLPNSPASPTWFAIDSDLQVAAANIGQGNRAINLSGLIAIPPGYGLGIDIISGSGTSPLYGITIIWDEIVY